MMLILTPSTLSAQAIPPEKHPGWERHALSDHITGKLPLDWSVSRNLTEGTASIVGAPDSLTVEIRFFSGPASGSDAAVWKRLKREQILKLQAWTGNPTTASTEALSPHGARILCQAFGREHIYARLVLACRFGKTLAYISVMGDAVDVSALSQTLKEIFDTLEFNHVDVH
jgi:hypothetical protein